MRDDDRSASLPDGELDWRLVDQYLAGILDQEAAAQVQQWFASVPSAQQELEQIRAVVAGSGDLQERPIDPGVMMDRLRRRMQRAHPIRGTTHSRPSEGMAWAAGIANTRSPWRGAWYGGVAMIAALLMAVAWIAGGRHVTLRTAHAALTYATPNGERANITLPDGSTVALGVASRLIVPADYVTGHRTIWLSGEALFTVTHHDGGSFTVIAGTTTARVLGTSFIVRHYVTDSTTLVAVRDGKVAVATTAGHSVMEHPLVLRVAQQAEIDRWGGAHVGRAAPGQFGFATGTLTLNDVLLPQAIPELDRWYDADIRLGDPVLAKQRVTGEYAAGSIADLAAILGWTFDVRTVRNGRILTLYPR